MKRLLLLSVFTLASGALSAAAQETAPPPHPMTWFVTSVGSGKGGDLGGLAGADAHCQKLAAAVGSGNRTWHAYLSTQAEPGQPAVNARDRIGTGPWYNAKGVQIAADLADLHGDTVDLARKGNLITRRSSLTETGGHPNNSDDTPSNHDIITGSRLDGTAFTDSADHTCSNWTNGSHSGSAQVGHFDRNANSSISWVSAHGTNGCDPAGILERGGGGLFYCFAIN
jgi:hypothetical protein